MSAAGFVVLLLLCAAIAIPAVLAARSAARSEKQLVQSGRLAVAEIVAVDRVEDVVVQFEFVLPDGRSIQRGTDMLPLTFRNLQVGEKMVVRFNPKLPAICRLVPEADFAAVGKQSCQ